MPTNIDSLLSVAELDYVAARLLFLNEFSVSGVTVGSLSIEKHLKAFLIKRKGLSEKDVKEIYLHNLEKLFKDVRKIEPKFDNNRLERIIKNFNIGSRVRYPDDYRVAINKIPKQRRPIDTVWLNDLDYAFYKLIEITGQKTIALERIENGFHSEWQSILKQQNLRFR